MDYEKQLINALSVFLAPPVRFTNRSDLQEVTCSAQETAQLTAEVSDYDAQVCERNRGLYCHIVVLLLALIQFSYFDFK